MISKISVGDLIYSGSEGKIGLVLEVVPVEPFKLMTYGTSRPIIPPVDIKVLWGDGARGWCLGETVIILSSVN
jgi:hypothetical protein